MVIPVLLALSLLWTAQAGASQGTAAKPAAAVDQVALLVRAIEKAAAAGDGTAIRAIALRCSG